MNENKQLLLHYVIDEITNSSKQNVNGTSKQTENYSLRLANCIVNNINDIEKLYEVAKDQQSKQILAYPQCLPLITESYKVILSAFDFTALYYVLAKLESNPDKVFKITKTIYKQLPKRVNTRC